MLFLLFVGMWIVFNGRFTIEILIFGIVLSAALYLFVWKVMGFGPKQEKAILKKSGKAMSELAGVMETFPQVLYNVTIPAAKKGHWQEDAEIAALIDTYTKELGDNGRILVRESGTEPLIRVMVEGKDAVQMENAAQAITAQVRIFAGA